MNVLRYIILTLLVLNLPGWTLANINPVLSSTFSYMLMILMLYYFINNNNKESIPTSFLILGLLYFVISALVDSSNTSGLITTAFKYILVIVCLPTIIRDTTNMELVFFNVIGAMSLFMEMFISDNLYGRFSGFYLNPNTAGFVCITGFWFSDNITKKWLRSTVKFLFIITGFATFSRTFFLILVVTLILSSFFSKRNIIYLFSGVLTLSLFLSLSRRFEFNTFRVEAFEDLLNGKYSENLIQDGRTETWAVYYDQILESPLFGNGYLSMSGKTIGEITVTGVHNTMLMILGEAGFLAFISYFLIYGNFLMKSFSLRKIDPTLFLICTSLIAFMLTSHNFFDNYIIITVSIWVNIEIKRKQNLINYDGQFRS